MDAEQLNQALYDKMAAEQNEFRSLLLGKTPEEILNCAYEYAMQEDILLGMEAAELLPEQAAALLESPSPLKDVYEDFRARETNHMDTVRECIETLADCLLETSGRLPVPSRSIRKTPDTQKNTARLICSWLL